ncbi:MAG: hypothetical protein CMB97_00315 [Flavobacteriaceae bacterium]|nr:hypothetical protein [Flavobacteriaceae bacterium]
MGKKIFVTYKYGDTQVRVLPRITETSVRNYVDVLQDSLDKDDHLNKGEADDEDLSHFRNETIASTLRDKIYDSSITIVVISKGMKEIDNLEDDQWIPWEVSYSLTEYTRSDRTSKTNAVLAVVLPDKNNNYEYFIVDDYCPNCKYRLLRTNFLFRIIRENMFNIKEPEYTVCNNHVGDKACKGYSSYIYSVKWDDFIDDIAKYLIICEEINSRIGDYDITKK